MRNLILFSLVSTFAMSGFFSNEAEVKAAEANENARLCKMFTEKVEDYESNMRDDELAAATLESYKQRMSTYCNNSSLES